MTQGVNYVNLCYTALTCLLARLFMALLLVITNEKDPHSQSRLSKATPDRGRDGSY